MKKNLSDTYLLSKWRQALLLIWGRCPFTGETDASMLECHHFVHKRNKMLRYDLANGIVLRKDVHNVADTIEWRNKIAPLLDTEYLSEQEKIDHKNYLVQNAMTRLEFEQMMLDRIKESIESHNTFNQSIEEAVNGNWA